MDYLPNLSFEFHNVFNLIQINSCYKTRIKLYIFFFFEFYKLTVQINNCMVPEFIMLFCGTWKIMNSDYENRL